MNAFFRLVRATIGAAIFGLVAGQSVHAQPGAADGSSPGLFLVASAAVNVPRPMPAGPRERRSAPERTSSAPAGVGPGWLSATQGYRYYDQGRFAAAADAAQTAVDAEPQTKHYRHLLINALNAAGRPDDTLAAVQEATRLFGADEHWLATESVLLSHKAAAKATEVYRGLERGDLELATTLAAQAVQLAPDSLEYQMLLIDLLVRQSLWAQADAAVTAALDTDPHAVTTWLWRAVIRHARGEYALAVSDFEHAMSMPELDDVQHRWLRLLAIDSALKERDLARGTEWLSHPVLDTGKDAEWRAALDRRREALRNLGALTRPAIGLGTLDAADLTMPAFRCRLTPYGRACLVVPGIAPADKGFDAASAAYQWMAQSRWQEAEAEARRAVDLAPRNQAYRQLLFDALVSGGRPSHALSIADQMVAVMPGDAAWRLRRLRLWADSGRVGEAQAELRQLLAVGGAERAPDPELAYLAIRLGDDESAQLEFEKLASAGALKGSAWGDAGFSALRLRLDRQALTFFRHGIDSLSDSARQEPPPQGTEESIHMFRRAIAEVSRVWGLTLSLTMSRDQPLPAEAGLGGGVPTRSTVSGFEAYWRPFGYRNGEALEAFVRGYATLQSSQAGPIGWKHGVGSVGLRWQPVSGSPVTLAAWRQLPFGVLGEADWVVQASYFKGWGTDVRDVRPAWWTGQVTGEWSRSVTQKHTYAAIEGRIGHIWKLGHVETAWAWQPFASARAELNSQALAKSTQGLDIGLSLKRAFREDAYTAPRSTFELSWHHRLQQWGGGRPGGVIKLITTY